MIYKNETYIDDQNRSIFALTPTDGGEVVYAGTFRFQFNVNGQPIMVERRDPIAGATIDEAFANIPEALKASHAAAEAQVRADIEASQRKQLVLPGSLPIPHGGANGHAAPPLRFQR